MVAVVVHRDREEIIKQAGGRLVRAFGRFCLEKNEKNAMAALKKEIRSILKELTIDKLNKD